MVSLRHVAAVLALLALVPVGVYFFNLPHDKFVLSLGCVCLVAGSLYVMFGPSDAARGIDRANAR